MADNSSTSNFKLVKEIIIVLVMLFIADYAVGSLLKWMFYQQTIGWEPMIIESVERTTDDIIVFGSSYANSQYDSKIIEEESGLTCYNAGIPGQSLIYATAVQECMLSRYTPKLFIVDISPKDLVLRETRPDYIRLNVLLPFVRDYDIGDIVFKRNKFERFKVISRIYPYNSMIIGFLLNWGKKDKFYKGYQPFDTKLTQERLDEVLKSSFGDELNQELELDPYKVEIFHRFINNAKESGSKVVFVISPKIFKYGSNWILEYIKEEVEKSGTELIDWKYHEDFLVVEEYRDIHHLNRIGASRFSRELTKELKIRNCFQ
ncbi:MAG: hypothetical protein HKN92_01445 [Chitinophagales bacterium]|nr:hypothetical protein [Chitinophagales bacterium]